MPVLAAATAVIAWLRTLSPLVKIPLKVGLLLAALLVIPVPEWASSIPGKLGSMPETVQYLLYVSQLAFGLGALASAYAIRAAWDIVSGAIKGS